MVLQVNRAFTTITGYAAEDVIGQPSRILSPEQNDTDFYDDMYHAIHKIGSWRGEIWNCRKNGELYLTLFTITAVKSDSGEITHFVSTLTDITELKEAHFKLKEMNQRLEERTLQAEAANQAKSQFLANMSHEIRTPLNGVIGMIGLLMGTELNERQWRFAESARISGEALLSLINDILDLSKIEAGKTELDEANFDLQATLDDLAVIIDTRAQDKNLEFHCVTDAGTPGRLRGDSGRLKQILVNVVGNAIKFTPSGEVRLRVEGISETSHDVLLRFTVKDTGIGIPAQKLDALFQSFSQVDASTTRKYGGTGLGLSISRQLVTLLGGEIGALSREGEGSEFWFTARFRKMSVEAGATEPVSTTALEASLQIQAPGKVRILLVEDNQVNREVALAILDQWGLAADTASNGIEAIQSLRNSRYDLVLMDVQMPEMDGLEATRTIRNPHSDVLNPAIPIVAMTAHAMQDDRKRCLEAGMNDYLTKPITPKTLASVLNHFLAGSPRRQIERMPLESRPEDSVLPVFDQPGLLRRLMNNREAAKRAIQSFLKDAPARITRIQECLETGDTAMVAKELHTLKGASATLGGEALRVKASEVEQILLEKGVEAMPTQLPDLLRTYEQFRTVLEKSEL